MQNNIATSLIWNHGGFSAKWVPTAFVDTSRHLRTYPSSTSALLIMRLLRPREVLRCGPAGRTSVEPGLLFAEGYESAEPDHAEAGSYSLIAAETRTGSQACA